MGSEPSKPAPPPPSPLLHGPWREMDWGSRSNKLQYVKDYKPDSSCQHLRILLHGPIGAGKSSFINTVNNVMQGRMTGIALADAASGSSFTKTYKTYRIQKGSAKNKDFYHFVFNDIMGLEGETNRGVHEDDIKLALNGHVRDGYTFNPVNSLAVGDQWYRESPALDDKTHVLVCVIPADNLSLLTDTVVKKMRDIRLAASRMGIPQMAILTKIDETCPEVSKDLKNVYKSKVVKKKMEEFSALLGIPMNCIFPVKNYHSEISINDDIDSLTLSTVRQMIDFGEDFLNSLENSVVS